MQSSGKINRRTALLILDMISEYQYPDAPAILIRPPQPDEDPLLAE